MEKGVSTHVFLLLLKYLHVVGGTHLLSTRRYDPDGEESRLGWGDEQFVDKRSPQILDGDSINHEKLTDERQWTSNKILIIDEAAEDAMSPLM